MYLSFHVAIGIVMAAVFLGICYIAYIKQQAIFSHGGRLLGWTSRKRRPIAIAAGCLIAVLATAAAVMWKDEQLRSKRGFTMERSFSFTGLSRGLSVTRTIAAAKCWLESKADRYDGEYAKDLDIWKAIEGTRYENYPRHFARARDKKHIELIKQDIDCELVIEKSARS